jgi:DNA-binding NarL/FixJ family response regulator
MDRTEDLLERDRELALLRRLVDDAVAGQGGIALIEGPAGIGKSRLLATVRDQASDRMTVLSARCGELERDFSFGAVRQLFEPLARMDRGAAALTGAAAPAAGVLGSPSDEEGLGEGSYAALHGLYWAVTELAEERPLLLALDDLHWSDRPTLRFVAYLARRLEGAPVLLAATLRSTDPGTDPNLIAEVAADPLCTSVRPGPLGVEAVSALVRARLGDDADPRFCAACHAATGGNPLLLRQLLGALADDGVLPVAGQADAVRRVGPRAVGRTVLRRLNQLSPDAIAVARAVAVLGDSATVATVGGLTGLDDLAVARAAGELARSDVLLADQSLRFVHPLVREAVYRDQSTAERELQHARAADVLARAHHSGEEVAAQLLHAPRRGDATTVEALRDAARRASRRGGPESAVAYLTRALDEPPPPHLRSTTLLELGLVEADMSAPDCARHLGEALGDVDDPAVRANACFALVAALLFTGEAPEGSALARRTAAELPAGMDDERQLLESIELLAVSFGGGDPNGLWERALRRAPAGERTLGSKFLAAVTAFVIAADAGPTAAVEAMALDALDGDLLVDSGNGLMWSATMVALTLAESPHMGPLADRLRAEVHRRGGNFATASVELWAGAYLLGTGALEEAGDALAEAHRLQEPFGSDPIGWSWSRGMLALQRVMVGRTAEVRDVLGARPAPDNATDGANFWRRALAELLLGEGDAAEALVLAREMSQVSDYVRHPTWNSWRSIAGRALGMLGRDEEALETLNEELALAQRCGAPGVVGRCQRQLGEQEGPAGLERLEEAVRVLTPSPARLERARALAAFGSALRREGRPADAREPLREALELAEACGCQPLVETARSELYAAGARPRTAALSGVAALTAREARVATLAADGRTNREIAQSLYVTPKTVEVHLSSAYRKLGIRSRRELPAAMTVG